jgi:hypothetical protein
MQGNYSGLRLGPAGFPRRHKSYGTCSHSSLALTRHQLSPSPERQEVQSTPG